MPKFHFNHNNINVLDLDKSVNFYKSALSLTETKRYSPEDGSFILVYLGDNKNNHRLELTWLKARKESYNLGDNEFHLAFTTDDYENAYKLHKQMKCICFENPEMGIYFIADPDNYWIEILPEKVKKI